MKLLIPLIFNISTLLILVGFIVSPIFLYKILACISILVIVIGLLVLPWIVIQWF